MNTNRRKIGFIGTGIMGSGMARRLIANGHQVKIYNRTRDKAEAIAKVGGEVADTPADAAQGSEVIFTMLSDPTAVLEVVEGNQGVLAGIERDAILIDSSTVSPSTTLRVMEKLKIKGAHMLDAPVFGSKNEAETGQLGLIVGGNLDVLTQVKDVLGNIGQITHVGGNGMGAYAKLVVNLIMAASLQAFSEGMVLATKAGVDPNVMLQLILSSRARSGIIEMKSGQILKRDFTPFFPLRLMAKDLGLIVDSANYLDIPLPLARTLKDSFMTCVKDGLANEDFAAIVKVIEKEAGVEVKFKQSENGK